MTSLNDGAGVAEVGVLKTQLRSQYRKKLNSHRLDSKGLEKLHNNLRWLLGKVVKSNVALYKSFSTEAPIPQPWIFS